ncbi:MULTISPECIES: helix-turn-helix transcriptional regulator [unclassified Microbacterium]|uniref:helix-turn-helix transcriptional regulator n=1 Tax=unclassified Microbacterium TaxID=2609290 RepID=UPI000EA96456|nr:MULTISPECIES: helix-turn-helix transcriptional regulator [unclassified Microbacterium]MBT2485899.1 helix-turn-helix transcriptional regulator [Microbacterium sp. ISL-108]RKN68653.1 XRE family transcriptional regulator [Microbacterium sp. CGR2]
MSHRQNHVPWLSRKAEEVGEQDPDVDEAWEDFATRLGLHIRRLREVRGLSQEAVAYRANVSRLTYLRYERGEAQSGAPANPTLRTLIALSQVLEVPLSDLVPAGAPDVTAR